MAEPVTGQPAGWQPTKSLQGPVPITRVPPLRRLTPMEQIITALLAKGLNYPQAGQVLGIKPSVAKMHCHAVAAKLPGDLPALMRVVAWWRGATLDVLTGANLPEF